MIVLIPINKKTKICHNMPIRAEKNIIPGRNHEINYFFFYFNSNSNKFEGKRNPNGKNLELYAVNVKL